MGSLVIAVGDVHIPDHSEALLQRVVRDIGCLGPKMVVSMGDVLDLETLSHFRCDPMRRSCIDSDKRKARWYYGELMEASGGCLVSLCGNHEWRGMKMLADRAPQLAAALPKDALTFKDVLPVGSRWIGPGRPFVYGGIAFMHGDGLSNNYSARIRKIGMSVVSGHSHRLSINYETSLTRTLWSLETGCVCRNPSHYSKTQNPRQQWQRGYAIIEIANSGKAQPRTVSYD
jgi:hypothetical protein